MLIVTCLHPDCLVFFLLANTLDNKMYLIPIDSKNSKRPDRAKNSFVLMDSVISQLTKHRRNINIPIIFVLDCCRIEIGNDRSVFGSASLGLGGFNNPTNIAILYSTANGYAASD